MAIQIIFFIAGIIAGAIIGAIFIWVGEKAGSDKITLMLLVLSLVICILLLFFT